jgi:hypothetical protein
MLKTDLNFVHFKSPTQLELKKDPRHKVLLGSFFVWYNSCEGDDILIRRNECIIVEETLSLSRTKFVITEVVKYWRSRGIKLVSSIENVYSGERVTEKKKKHLFYLPTKLTVTFNDDSTSLIMEINGESITNPIANKNIWKNEMMLCEATVLKRQVDEKLLSSYKLAEYSEKARKRISMIFPMLIGGFSYIVLFVVVLYIPKGFNAVINEAGPGALIFGFITLVMYIIYLFIKRISNEKLAKFHFYMRINDLKKFVKDIK